MNSIRLIVIFSASILFNLYFTAYLPQLSFAGPSCDEVDYNTIRFQAIQTKFIDGYRFDITKPPVYSSNSEVDGEGCKGDSFILVTDTNDKVVFFKRMYIPIRFGNLDKFKIEHPDKVDVGIVQHSGGGSCCEYLHLFQTKQKFKYLGQRDIPF